MLEKGRKCSLKSNPERVVRTDWNANDWNIESRGLAIVDQQAIGIIEAPAHEDIRK